MASTVSVSVIYHTGNHPKLRSFKHQQFIISYHSVGCKGTSHVGLSGPSSCKCILAGGYRVAGASVAMAGVSDSWACLSPALLSWTSSPHDGLGAESREDQSESLEPGLAVRQLHLCHVLLAKANPKASLDSRGGEKDSISRWKEQQRVCGHF